MIIVSACLAGKACRYDGKSKPCLKVLQLVKDGKAIPVCPEQLGGLSTPRKPAEQKNGRVLTIDGVDLTDEFDRGAKEVLKIAYSLKCGKAILKSNSPSCGSGCVYDGNFTGVLINGDGVCSKLLKENGIEVLSESELEK